jgi:hypothetical protein
MHTKFANSEGGREKEVGFVKIFTNSAGLRCKATFAKRGEKGSQKAWTERRETKGNW